jgi:hypothetical protein
VLVDLREKLAPFYSDIGRPSIDPELMIRMLTVGYCYGIRFERKLCEEVKLHLMTRFPIILRSRLIATATFGPQASCSRQPTTCRMAEPFSIVGAPETAAHVLLSRNVLLI